MPREVRIGSQVIGGVRVPVVAGPAGGGDLARCDAAAPPASTATRPAMDPGGVRTPLVAAFDPRLQQLPPVGSVDGLLVSAGRVLEADLAGVVAAPRLPVILRRPAGMSPNRWLAAAARLAEAGAGDLLLCEGGWLGGPTGSSGGDEHSAVTAPSPPDLVLLSEVRGRTDVPVFVDVSGSPGLTAAAVAAGADGLLLPTDAGTSEVAHARELAATLAPLLGGVPVPEALEGARQAIDQVDIGLATLLERRAELAGAVQRLKPVGGFAGRDPGREREVVTAMVHRAPGLGLVRVRRIMETVIEAGLELSESRDPDMPASPGSIEPCRSAAGTDVSRAS